MLEVTKAQFFEKLKGQVPEWFFEEEEYNEAYFYGAAAVLEQIQTDGKNHVDQTFIGNAEGDILDAHGEERTKPRLENENDSLYRARIRTISNQSPPPDLQRIVESLIITGTVTIREDFNDTVYASRGYYASRKAVVCDQIENTFSVIVDKQIHEPYSFADRENFVSRGSYVGSVNGLIEVYRAIVQAVNENKAFGTLYRLVEAG